MARIPREDQPDTWYHIINRGIAKRALFETDDEARFFLSRLARQVRAERIEIHAFCLMTTHYHLLVRSPIGDVSEGMRLAQSAYSRYFNRRHKRDGSLVRGRFFSRSAKTLEYRHTLLRYIHHNPVKAGLASQAHDYRLSSAGFHMTGHGAPWLNRNWVANQARNLTGHAEFTPATYLAAFGTDSPVLMNEIEELVEARLRCKATRSPHDLINTNPEQVRAWMQRKATLADGHRVGVPICARSALERALGHNLAAYGPWSVADGTRLRSGDELARIGCLHDMCGLSWEAISKHVGKPVTPTRRLGKKHCEFIKTDPTYADRVHKLVCMALHSVGSP
jgi:REP element-mobilizing transposase RayT